MGLASMIGLPCPSRESGTIPSSILIWTIFDPLAISATLVSSGEEALRAYSHESGMLRWNVNFSSAAGALFCKARMLSLFTACFSPGPHNANLFLPEAKFLSPHVVYHLVTILRHFHAVTKCQLASFVFCFEWRRDLNMDASLRVS